MKKYNGVEIFRKRDVIIATMHRKEKIIAPLFKNEYQMKCEVPKGFNTDQFGTFSGEIERIKNPLETARVKALAALSNTSATLAIASEGSFGPNPESPFITGNEELVILIDVKNDFEIIGRHFTEKTNFNHQKIENLNDLKEFTTRIGFPEHGVILKSSDNTLPEIIIKDFLNFLSLENQVIELLNKGKIITAETDMRAMNNPTRMEAIRLATKNLIANINLLCPECNAPGFNIVDAIRGLTCSLCKLPTKGIKAYSFSCKKCCFNCNREKNGITFQDPTFCDYCNP